MNCSIKTLGDVASMPAGNRFSCFRRFFCCLSMALGAVDDSLQFH